MAAPRIQMRVLVVATLAIAFRGVLAQQPTECSAAGGGQELTLAANSGTVHWGYYYDALAPNLVASSGDIVNVEMITHHAGDDYDKMIKGDAGVEDIYQWAASTGQNIDFRGRSGVGDGVHILTGPIYVCGAEPGDVLQIDILDLQPRKNPATGKTYGSNAAANWGYQFRAGFRDGDAREVITIYEVVEEDGQQYIVPDYSFRFAGGPTDYPGPTLPCIPEFVSVPEVLSNGDELSFNNSQRLYSGRSTPCVDGTQTFKSYDYPGLITTHPTGTEDYSIRGMFKVPANIHIGNIGLSPAYNTTVDSVPPSIHGGNMDNKRVHKGATLYLPVQVAGAYLYMGDAHMAQGDSELDGTGVETSINGRMRLTLHKADELPTIVQDLSFPLIEEPESFVVQGFQYADYLKELDEPFKEIYSASSIDMAFTVAYNKTRDWIMDTFNMTEDAAITFITVACDFGVTQVVDGNWGVHVVVPKMPLGYPTGSPASAPSPLPAVDTYTSGAFSMTGGAWSLVLAGLLAALLV